MTPANHRQISATTNHQNRFPDKDFQYQVRYQRSGWTDSKRCKGANFYAAEDVDRNIRNILEPKRAGAGSLTALTLAVRPVHYRLTFGRTWPWSQITLQSVEPRPTAPWEQLIDLADALAPRSSLIGDSGDA